MTLPALAARLRATAAQIEQTAGRLRSHEETHARVRAATMREIAAWCDDTPDQTGDETHG